MRLPGAEGRSALMVMVALTAIVGFCLVFLAIACVLFPRVRPWGIVALCVLVLLAGGLYLVFVHETPLARWERINAEEIERRDRELEENIFARQGANVQSP